MEDCIYRFGNAGALFPDSVWSVCEIAVASSVDGKTTHLVVLVNVHGPLLNSAKRTMWREIAEHLKGKYIDPTNAGQGTVPGRKTLGIVLLGDLNQRNRRSSPDDYDNYLQDIIDIGMRNVLDVENTLFL